ncbi:MAG: exo-alpha-sialidase, partial [Clostridia bacterium]|nr:exo-alpha-sialidase [Clostridia bacterium]
ANGELILIERNDLGSRYTKAKLSAPDKWDSYKLLRYDNNDENSPIMQTVYSLNNIKRLASGNLLLTYHNNNTKVRDNIAVALSKDDGVTWPYKLTLDTRIHSSYAMIDEMENGDIIVVYDQGRGRTVRPGSSEILLSRLREEDIIAGKPVTERAVLKRLVSRYEEAPREDCLTEQLSAAERIMAAHPEAVTAITSAAQKAKENLTLENYITLCETCDSFIN